MRLLFIVSAIALAACGSSSPQTPRIDAEIPPPPVDAGVDAAPDPYSDPAQVQARLEATLDALTGMGNRRAGTAGADSAADWVLARFQAIGLENVRTESFRFPRFQQGPSSLAVTIDGVAVTMAHEPLAYSGAGTVDADVVYLDRGHPEDYVGVDVTNKIVMVRRDDFFHRQAQYDQVIAHGGAAMLYASASPNNLIQIGTVAEPEDGLGPLPTVAIGSDDALVLEDAFAMGKLVHATIAVDASLVDATGRNVIGVLPGTDPSGAYLLVGAHLDTWYAGAVDNTTGVAALVEVAEALASRPQRRLGVVFVAYDAEELGLFGGYDYLRDHVVVAQEPMLAFVNLEMPASGPADPRAVAYTTAGPIEQALLESQTYDLYTNFVAMDTVPMLFGGLIPTDIQGMYWFGIQGWTTFCSTPYYHTPEDTADKVDTAFFADAVLRLEQTLDFLDDDTLAAFEARDPQTWAIDVTTATMPSGDLVVSVTAPAPSAIVRVWLDVDDFTRVFKQTVVADGSGAAQVAIPAAALSLGAGDRWVHVTAGDVYPRAEAIVPVP